MITAVEVKKQGVESGFGFKPGEPLLSDTQDSAKARSQFATYAAEIMLRQHRTHLYMFYICGWYARVFRWDRSGAVVSQPIDMKTNPRELLNLIYRLAMSDRQAQGFDMTATLASEDDQTKLEQYAPPNRYLKEYKALALDNVDDHPLYVVRVPFRVFSVLRLLTDLPTTCRLNATRFFGLQVGERDRRDERDF